MRTRDLDGAPRQYTPTLDALVIALCHDFDRREEAVRKKLCGRRVSVEYKYINYRISEAACEVAGDVYGPIYIREIGKKVGFANSEVSCVSESVYKTEKLSVKLAIARYLFLLD